MEIKDKFILPEDRIPDCRDQGKLDICVAMAITAVMQILYYIQTGERKQFSPTFAAGVWRDPINRNMKSLNPDTALQYAQKLGCCFTEDLPQLMQNPEAFDYVEAHPELYDKAAKHKTGEFTVFNAGNRAKRVEQIKNALLEYQYPIVAVVKEKMSSHCVPIVGWDDNKGRFYVMNSWGDRGGAKGIDTYKYEDLKRGYLVTMAEEAEVENMSVKKYSLKKDGEKQLSKNFKVKEFRCKDGSDTILIDTELVKILQKIRDFFGKTVINSAYRTAAYNTKIGGATTSQHMYGKAADIVIPGVDPLMVARYAEMLIPDSGGIGYYYDDSNFTHVDMRKNKARWKNGAGSNNVSVANHGMVSVSEIVNELSSRGIITDTALWLKKLAEDKNAYWLARKAAAFTVNRGRTSTYGDVSEVCDIVTALGNRNIITDVELWKRELPEDTNLYWLANKICNMTK